MRACRRIMSRAKEMWPTIPFRENSSAVCPFIATDKSLKNISSDSWTIARVLSAKGPSKFWFILWILIFVISSCQSICMENRMHYIHISIILDLPKNVFCLLLSLKNQTNCLYFWWMPSYINFNLVLFNNIQFITDQSLQTFKLSQLFYLICPSSIDWWPLYFWWFFII